MKNVLIVGGTSGIGLSIALNLKEAENIYILGRNKPKAGLPNNVSYHFFDLKSFDLNILEKYKDIDTLIISAGFGKLGLFQELTDEEIQDYFTVNTVGVIRIIKFFYKKLQSNSNFYCAVVGSISGYISSPFFSVYAASKAALRIFIESVNIELEKAGYSNKILHVAPGAIKGTAFSGGENFPEQTKELAIQIIEKIRSKEDLFIPNYEEIYKGVLQRAFDDFREAGRQSYEYKMLSGRI